METGSGGGLWRNYADLGLIPRNSFFFKVWVLTDFLANIFFFISAA